MFLPAWAVDGSKVPASMARRVAWATSSGSSGIVDAADLQVLELPTPGGAVRIMPGTAIIENTYPSAVGQSYVVANDAAFDLAVPATGSGSGATRYVIVRVDDPEFGGQVPAEPLTGAYCEPTLVSSIAGLNYPFVVLARIDQPPTTATIRQSIIPDLRELANPGIWYEQRSYNLIQSQEEVLTVGGTTGEFYPNAAIQYVDIPKWAVEVSVIVTWSAVRYRGGSTNGFMWMEFGPSTGPSKRQVTTQKVQFDSDGASQSQRVDWSCPDTVYIPWALRGTRQAFVPKASLQAGSGNARPIMTALSGVTFQLYFREIPAGS